MIYGLFVAVVNHTVIKTTSIRGGGHEPKTMTEGFLGLPAELRNVIYGLVVSEYTERAPRILLKDAIKRQPSLLHVLRHEMLPIYYASVRISTAADEIRFSAAPKSRGGTMSLLMSIILHY